MKNLGSEVEEEEEEGGWKLTEAFEMDTRSTTWPPRSYTCTFCRREFRSAQALGGHMNVHRRDRARFHHQAQAQSQAQTQTQAEYLNRLRSNNNYELGSTSLMSCCSVDNDPFISWANNVGFGVFYQFDDNNNNNINNNHNCNVGVCDEMKVSEVISSKNNEVSEPIEELDLELRLGCMCNKIR